jgi:hypothetical protein
MCFIATTEGMQKLAQMKTRGRRFVYGYSVKEITSDLKEVYNYYQYGMRFPLGSSMATYDNEVIGIGESVYHGFHLTFRKKDLKEFVHGSFISDSSSGRKICVIRVVVDVNNILAIGQHKEAGSFPATPDHAFLAKTVYWDGKFNLKTSKRTISKRTLDIG